MVKVNSVINDILLKVFNKDFSIYLNSEDKIVINDNNLYYYIDKKDTLDINIYEVLLVNDNVLINTAIRMAVINEEYVIADITTNNIEKDNVKSYKRMIKYKNKEVSIIDGTDEFTTLTRKQKYKKDRKIYNNIK